MKTVQINLAGFEVPIYDVSVFGFEPGVTVLLGCNGSGKTTLMREIEKRLKEDGVETYSYDIKNANQKLSGGLVTGGLNAENSALYLMSKFMSEGEQMKCHLEILVPDFGRYVSNVEKNDVREGWAFFDSLDSGWSIDNCKEFAEFLDNTVLKSKPESTDLYILISANSYELANHDGWDRVDVQTGAHLNRFESYENYADYVMRTRRHKEEIWS